jgi:hypothetical protein
VQREIGNIHYLSHQKPDGCTFSSLKVVNSMQQFLDELKVDNMPAD